MVCAFVINEHNKDQSEKGNFYTTHSYISFSIHQKKIASAYVQFRWAEEERESILEFSSKEEATLRGSQLGLCVCVRPYLNPISTLTVGHWAK